MMTKWLIKWRKNGLPQTKDKHGVSYADPLKAGRHPFQTYMLIFAVITTLPAIFGVTVSGSVSETLPWPLGVLWTFSLFFGAVGALLGSYWQGDYATALTIERIGLVTVGIATIVFSIIIVVVGGVHALLVGGVIIGFGLASLQRARDISKIIHLAINKNGQA